MNLAEFSEDYAGMVAELEPRMRRARDIQPVLREDYGYTLEHLLMRRLRALAELPAAMDRDRLLEQISLVDQKLIGLAELVRQAFGVDVLHFLGAPEPRRGSVGGSAY